MGMFDYFKSSYYIGDDFTDVTCQTKSLDCTMDFYWLDPAGVLWVVDYGNTYDVVIHAPGDPLYSHDQPWSNFDHVPNGNLGRVVNCRVTRSVEVYPEKYTPSDVFPRCVLYIVDGFLVSYQDVTLR